MNSYPRVRYRRRSRGCNGTPLFTIQDLTPDPEKYACRRFPNAASPDLVGGPRRNFQVFDALDFLAEVTQHIPNKGEHLVRCYGWYSHRRRAMRAQQKPGRDVTIDRRLASADSADQAVGRERSARAWAALIQRVYEVDPLKCVCGGRMRIISFIEGAPIGRGRKDTASPRPVGGPFADDAQGTWPTEDRWGSRELEAP